MSFRVMSLGVSQNYSLETQIISSWEEILGDNPGPQQLRVLRWIRNKVSVEDFFVLLGVISKGKRIIRLACHPLNLKIILHVDLSLTQDIA